MNLKQKMRNFFTLNRKSNGGFTLVELIVVIAILAILGGVAVPVYSGYIKRANRAADEILLDAVNTAFASACILNGESNYSRDDIAPDDGKIVDGEFVYTGPFADDFNGFYEGGEFKVITSVVYDATFGGFKDPATADQLTISYGGKTITVSGETLQALQGSTFGSVMGGEALLQEITGLTNMINAGGSKLADDLLADTAAGGYMQKYAAYLGVENASNLTGDDLIAAVGAKLSETYRKNGIVIEDLAPEEQISKIDSAMVNGMVFYAAEGMKDYDVDRANTLLNSDNIYSSLSSDPAARLAEASLVYGMYAGFVNSEFNTGGAVPSTDNPMAAIQNISGSGEHSANFQAYLDSAQGQADVKAYMEAMDVINDASGNDAAASVLVNGFSDSELADLLTQVLGK